MRLNVGDLEDVGERLVLIGDLATTLLGSLRAVSYAEASATAARAITYLEVNTLTGYAVREQGQVIGERYTEAARGRERIRLSNTR